MGRLRNISHFIFYNNTTLIIVGLIFLGGGTALAANDDLRETVVSSVVEIEETVTSVDNSYIRTVDLNTFDPTVQIIAITDDGEYYYVEYDLVTIAIEEYVWQPITRREQLQVEMARVADRDLGLYLAEEFAELTSAQKRFLEEAQLVEEEAGVQQKVVTRDYQGLVGRFLDTEEVAFDGYTPVVEEVVDNPVVAVVTTEEEATVSATEDGTTADDSTDDEEIASGGGSDSSTTEEEADTSTTTDSDTATSSSTSTSETDTSTTTATSSSETTEEVIDTVPPELRLVGDASIEIDESDTFTDPGATATDETDGDISDSIVVSGTVDTATVGNYELTYGVSDAAGNEVTVIRTITVVAAEVESESDSEDVDDSAASSTAAS